MDSKPELDVDLVLIRLPFKMGFKSQNVATFKLNI
jgi:hypothetical protein